jgi:adenylyl- and sulfurtransferase ThiI
MQDTTLLMVFTGILAAAVLMQTFLFFGMYRYFRRITVWLETVGKDLLGNVENISSKVEEGMSTIKLISDDLKPVSEKISNATDVVHKRVLEVDSFMAETIKAAQLEILRIQDTIQVATRRTQETIELLHSGIQSPISEINAIRRGLTVAIDMLLRRRRSLSKTPTQDEEMFI